MTIDGLKETAAKNGNPATEQATCRISGVSHRVTCYELRLSAKDKEQERSLLKYLVTIPALVIGALLS